MSKSAVRPGIPRPGNFIEDADDPYAIVRSLMAAVPRGSYLVLSHLTADHDPES
jgi:hypothetical protein